MTKAEIIDAVYEQVGGFSKKEAAELVEAVFDTMKEVLAEGEKIKISGFGNFIVRDKQQRTGRNPQTGDPIPISARRVLTFKPSQVLKGELNPHKEQAKQELAEEQGLGEAGGSDGQSAKAEQPTEDAAPKGSPATSSEEARSPSDRAR